MDFAFIGPVFSQKEKQKRKNANNKKIHAKSVASTLGKRVPSLTYQTIASQSNNIYKTSYYLNLIPSNDSWIHSPLMISSSTAPFMSNHNKILNKFECPSIDNKHKYSFQIKECLDLFQSLRTNNDWQLINEKEELKIYSNNNLNYLNIIKSTINISFSTPIITGIILNSTYHRHKWDKYFIKSLFIERLSMYTHITYQQLDICDIVLLNFIYPLSDGSILIGSKSINHSSYPSLSSLYRGATNINLIHIIPKFNQNQNLNQNQSNDDYLSNSIVIYYNHIIPSSISHKLKNLNNNNQIKEWLINNSKNILKLKHYIKSIKHTLHRKGILHIPPYPMLKMLGIKGICISRKRKHINNNVSNNDHDIIINKYLKKISLNSSSSIVRSMSDMNYFTRTMLTRRDWLKGHRISFDDMKISSSMTPDDDDHKDDIKKNKKKLSFRTATAYVTLSTLAVSDLLTQTHDCSLTKWIKVNIKMPSGLYLYSHIDNKINNKYYHYMGQAVLDYSPEYIYSQMFNPSFRFSYDIKMDSMKIIEKLNNNTYISRVIHSNKQCLINTKRETIVIIKKREIQKNNKYVISAISVDHPKYIKSGYIRAIIKSSGWVIQRDINNNKHTKISYIVNIDFGGNLPDSIKKTVASKQPLVIYHLAKELRKTQKHCL